MTFALGIGLGVLTSPFLITGIAVAICVAGSHEPAEWVESAC